MKFEAKVFVKIV